MADNVGAVALDVAVNQPNFSEISAGWLSGFDNLGTTIGINMGKNIASGIASSSGLVEAAMATINKAAATAAAGTATPVSLPSATGVSAPVSLPATYTGKIKTTIDEKSLDTSISKIKTKTKSGFSLIGKIASVAMIAGLVTSFVGSAIEMGSNLAEVQNVVDVTFGAMSADVSSWAKSASTAYGLNELQAKKYTGTMGAMLKSMGFGTAEAADMSKSMTGLAGDMASFYNLDSADAFAKIQSGISGETEPLKQLGINMNVANLDAYALAQGMQQSYSKMSQSSQALLRYNYLMSVSADAQGDFARTSGSWANQTRILANQWDSFKAGFGQGLINMFAPILRGINSVMAGLVNLGNTFAAFTGVLFGSQSMASVAADTSTAADSLSDLAVETTKAGKAANGALAGYDQLNVLSSSSSAGSSGSDAGSGTGITAVAATVATPTIDTSAMEAVVDKIKGIFNFQNIIDSWGNLKAALQPLGETIGSGLLWLWDNILVPFSQWVIADAVPAFLDMLAGAADVLNSAIVALQPLGIWLWDNFLRPIAVWTGGVIVSVLTGIGDGLTVVGDWISNNQQGFQAIVITIGSFAAAWGLVSVALGIYSIATGIATGVTGAFTAVLGVLTSPITLVIAIIGAVIAIVILLWQNWDWVVAQLKWSTGKMITDFSNAWISFVGFLERIWNAVATFFVNLWNGIASVAKSVWNSIASFFKNLWSSISGGIKTSWNSIAVFFTGLWSGITGGIRSAWNGAISFLRSIGSTIKNIFQGIGDFVTGIWDGMIGGIKGAINGITGALNFLIRGINKFKIDVPSWVTDMTGISDFGFNIPQIPALAQGGIVDQPTLAMVGDNRHSAEAITPIDKLQGMISAAMSQTGGNADMLKAFNRIIALLEILSDTDLQVIVGNEAIEDYAVRRQKRRNTRAGKTVSAMGV